MSAPPENKNPAPSVNGCRAHKDDQPAKQINSQNNDTELRKQGAADSLACVHRSWGFPTDELIRCLLDRGVPEQVLTYPYCIGGGRVVFHHQSFEPDLDGKLVITLRAEDRGKVIDLALTGRELDRRPLS
jgi:hypothetical protein